ncbi:hypothetical protein CRG98_024592 [Punica granatum]|uniref:Uncharacterized protein n=1 Tax=Punica granatum TaxID=22663 RepID=A0A2I0JFE7_PUNGR|nr:hypothetical protein CRG98_024592 [Punica granatum]
MSLQTYQLMVKQRFSQLLPGGPSRAMAVSGLLLLLFYVFSFNYWSSQDHSDLHLPFAHKWRAWSSGGTNTDPPTNLSHIVFGIVGSLKTWKGRKAYLESWWRPNISRGYLFLDGRPDNESLCPYTCPQILINEDIRKWKIYPLLKYPVSVRVAWSIVEAFRQGDNDVRWYVIADDDTVLFMDNIVQVLSKYDHTKYYYLGASSESILSNVYMSFEMGFGGAGFALSYPLVNAKWPMFMFNTRPAKNDPCETPHWFFFESIESENKDVFVTTYTRAEKRRLSPCSLGRNHSADRINRVQVFSPVKTRLETVDSILNSVVYMSFHRQEEQSAVM